MSKKALNRMDLTKEIKITQALAEGKPLEIRFLGKKNLGRTAQEVGGTQCAA